MLKMFPLIIIFKKFQLETQISKSTWEHKLIGLQNSAQVILHSDTVFIVDLYTFAL